MQRPARPAGAVQQQLKLDTAGLAIQRYHKNGASRCHAGRAPRGPCVQRSLAAPGGVDPRRDGAHTHVRRSASACCTCYPASGGCACPWCVHACARACVCACLALGHGPATATAPRAASRTRPRRRPSPRQAFDAGKLTTRCRARSLVAAVGAEIHPPALGLRVDERL